ncbi:MAG: prolipoprotein diacylglyceryl transferase [Zoogloeaceae bacterium]|nr:prolipoprotein diacylglyceryl transferase [Zoogloeaceae bacterium]
MWFCGPPGFGQGLREDFCCPRLRVARRADLNWTTKDIDDLLFYGVLAALTLYARKKKLAWFAVMDFIAPLVPPGLGFGRLGNFINGELWGRAADPSLPWAMVFPHVDNIARHPSQLYQAFLEGIVFFAVLWWFSAKPRATGAVSGMFLIGYGAVRFVAEFFREPDAGIFGLSYTISMGQRLSLPMIAAGVAMLVWSARRS